MSRLSKNIFYNLVGKLLLLTLGFISVKYIFGRLGEDALGIIYFTATMNSLLQSVLELGICQTTVREVSAHYSDKPSYIHDLIRTGSSFYWGAYILLGVIIYFLSPTLVEKWLNLSTMDTATAISALRILGIGSLIALPQSFYTSLFQGLQRMEFNNITDVVVGALRQFGTIAILVLGGSLFDVVYWYAACYGISIVIYLVVLSKFFALNMLIPGFSFYVIKKNLRFASTSMVNTITLAILAQVDKVIISKIMPVGLFGYYGLVYKNTSQPHYMMVSMAKAAYPSFSDLFQQNKRKSLRSQYRKMQDLVCFGVVPIYTLILFIFLPLYSYILNEEAANLLLLPSFLLCFAFFLFSTLVVPYFFSFAVGKPEITAKFNFYSLFFLPPITALLIYLFGLTGAGLSWILRSLSFYAYGVPRYCAECFFIPVMEWYWHVIKILILATLTYGTTWLLLTLMKRYDIQSLVLGYLFATVSFFIGSYYIITIELKKTLVNHIHSLKQKIVEAV